MHRELSFYQELVVRRADAPLNPDLVRRRLDDLQAAELRWIGHDGIGGHEIDASMQKFIDFVARELESRGIGVTSFHYAGPTYADDPAENRRLREGMRRTADGFSAWKPRAFVVHAGWLPRCRDDACRGMAEGEGILAEGARLCRRYGRRGVMDRIAENLRYFAELTAPHGISLALENVAPMAPLGAMEEQLEFIERIGMDNVGICLDAGHAHVEGRSAAEYARMAGRRLVETHFHDNLGPGVPPKNRPDKHWPVGFGTVNWPELIRALDEIGFDRPVTFETTGFPLPSAADGYRMSARFWRMLEDLAESP